MVIPEQVIPFLAMELVTSGALVQKITRKREDGHYVIRWRILIH
jgi:hypothetical protein